MRRIFTGFLSAILLAAIVVSGCGEPDSVEQDTLKQDLDKLAADAVELRGLAPKGEVQYRFVTTEALRERLQSDSEEEYPPEEMAIDREVFVLLDLLDEQQDLRTILVDVYTEQIAGFYDYETDELFVVSDEEQLGPFEKVVYIHEYAHALQDQYFDLNSILPDEEDNSDLSLAGLSLVEGDATFVMTGYMFNKLSRADIRALDLELEGSEAEKLEAAPRFIQEIINFPYEEGVNFVLATGGWENVLQAVQDLRVGTEGWEAINLAYEDVPRSTEQILHPEKYTERDEPRDVSMPDLESALGEGWSKLDSDVLGEFLTRVYLETFVPEYTAAIAAEGWDGDRLTYLKSEEGEKLLVLRSVWDSETDTGEFFDAYISFTVEKSGGTLDILVEDDTMRQWDIEGLNILLARNGTDVLIVIAPDKILAEKVLAQFPEFQAAP